MIRRDYIMKLVQQFIEALFLLLNEKDVDEAERQEKLQQFYKDYVGEDSEYYYTNEPNQIISFLEQKYGNELIQRVEMLADIMYADAMTKEQGKQRDMLLPKTLFFLNYLDDFGNTFSLVRQGKIDAIKNELEK